MNNRLSISSLAENLAVSTGKSRKSCEDFIREFFLLVNEALVDGDKLRIKGFGSFKVSDVAAKESIDVSTGQPTIIAAHKKVTFTPSPEMASIINAPFDIFESVVIDDDSSSIGDEGDSRSEQMKTGDENVVEDVIIEAGSEEEAYDDEFTQEAYKNIMPDIPRLMPPIPIESLQTQHKLTWDDFPPVEENGEEIQDYEPAFLNSRKKMSPAQIVWIVIAILFGVGISVFIFGSIFNWWPNIFHVFR